MLTRLTFAITAFVLYGAAQAQHLFPGWTKIETNLNYSTLGYGVAHDRTNDWFYTMSTVTGQTSNQVYIEKLDSYGNLLWTKIFTPSQFAYPDKIIVNSNHNVFFDYGTATTAPVYGLTLIGLNPSGSQIFGKSFATPFLDTVLALHSDASNDLFVATSAWPSFPQQGVYSTFLFSEYSLSGQTVFAKDYSSFAPDSATFDANGNVNATGTLNTTHGGAYYGRFSGVTGGGLFWKDIPNVYVAKSNTTTYNYFTFAVDRSTTGNYYLGTTTYNQVGNAAPTNPESEIQLFGPNDVIAWATGQGTLPSYVFDLRGGPKNVVSFLSSADDTSANEHIGRITSGALDWLYSLEYVFGIDSDCDDDVDYGLFFVTNNTISQVLAIGHLSSFGALDFLESYNPKVAEAIFGASQTEGQGLDVIFSVPTSPTSYNAWTEVLRGGPVLFDGIGAPATVEGGTAYNVGVMLDAPAPAGGEQVVLTSSSTAAVFANGASSTTAVVPAGQTKVNTVVHTTFLAKDQTVVITGNGTGVVRKGDTTIAASKLSSVSVASPVVRGNPVPVTVTLDNPAPAGGLTITVTSDSQGTIPNTTITVPEGDKSITTFIDSKVSGTAGTVNLTFTDPSGTVKTGSVVMK